MEEQVIQLAGQGISYGIQAVSTGARTTMQLAAMIKAIMEKQTATGEKSMEVMLKSGNQLEVVPVPQENMKAFMKEAKKHRLTFAHAKSETKEGFTDIVFETKDIARFNMASQAAGIFKNDKAVENEKQSIKTRDMRESLKERIDRAGKIAEKRNKSMEKVASKQKVKTKGMSR